MDSYTKSLEIFSKEGDETEKAYSYLRIGENYLAQKLDKNALSVFNQAYEIFEKNNDKRGLSFALDKLAIIKIQFSSSKILWDSPSTGSLI